MWECACPPPLRIKAGALSRSSEPALLATNPNLGLPHPSLTGLSHRVLPTTLRTMAGRYSSCKATWVPLLVLRAIMYVLRCLLLPTRGILRTLSVTEGLWWDLLNMGLGETEEKRSQWYSDPLGGGGRRATVQYSGNAQRRRYVRGLRVQGTSQSVRYLGGTVTRFPNPGSARKELLQIQMCFQSNTIFLHVKQVQKQPPERH